MQRRNSVSVDDFVAVKALLNRKLHHDPKSEP